LRQAARFFVGEEIYYTGGDTPAVQSAFTHGDTEADIRLAIDNAIYDGYLEGDEDAENKRLLVGFDRKGNPLEIYYNILDENTVRVFHAMEYRNIHNKLLDNE
jgi:hypothetical protein